MTTLTEKQIAILANAASRPDGSLLPLPDNMQLRGSARTAVFRALERRGLAMTLEDGSCALTEVGRATAAEAAISNGVGPDLAAIETPNATSETGVENSCSGATRGFRPGTRQAQLLDLLQRAEGADIDEMMEVTGWQSHSVRAVLSGFRKRGIEVSRTKEGNGVSVYRALVSSEASTAAS